MIVGVMMVISLDRSFVLNSFNSQYSPLLSALSPAHSLVARSYKLFPVYILCYYRNNCYKNADVYLKLFRVYLR